MPRVVVKNPTFGYSEVEIRVDSEPVFRHWDTPMFSVVVEKDIDYDSAPAIKGDKPPVIRSANHTMTIDQAKEMLAALTLAIEIAETPELAVLNGPLDHRYDDLLEVLNELSRKRGGN